MAGMALRELINASSFKLNNVVVYLHDPFKHLVQQGKCIFFSISCVRAAICSVDYAVSGATQAVWACESSLNAPWKVYIVPWGHLISDTMGHAYEYGDDRRPILFVCDKRSATLGSRAWRS